MPDDTLNPVLAKIERARALAAQRAAAEPAAPPSLQPARAETSAPAAPARASAPSAAPVRTPGASMTRGQRMVFDIARAAQLAGARDLTRREIWRRWCNDSGQAQLTGTVTGRVNELLATGWMLERRERRRCADSGNEVLAVYIPEHLLNTPPGRGA